MIEPDNIRIPLSRPDITEDDIQAVVAVLRTPQLSLGPQLPAFERAFAEYVGAAHGVALSSGTAGLHLGLQALGVREGDEVIVPSFAFVAAANAVRHVRATPVFADIDPVSLNITADTTRQVLSDRTRALMVVHTLGVPADMDPILAFAREHNLRVIEDACEAVGAEYRGSRLGALGDLGVFSFYPNKPMTTGEGGLLVTQDSECAKIVRALRNQGRLEGDGWLEHSLVGYNFRISDLNCALGLSQLRRIESILARREEIAATYNDVLRPIIADLILPPENSPEQRISRFAYVVRLSGRYGLDARDKVMRQLSAAGIGCRAYFPAVHLLPPYRGHVHLRAPLPITEHVAQRTLALPFHNALTREQIAEVCSVLQSALEAI